MRPQPVQKLVQGLKIEIMINYGSLVPPYFYKSTFVSNTVPLDPISYYTYNFSFDIIDIKDPKAIAIKPLGDPNFYKFYQLQ